MTVTVIPWVARFRPHSTFGDLQTEVLTSTRPPTVPNPSCPTLRTHYACMSTEREVELGKEVGPHTRIEVVIQRRRPCS